jgi:hypothetical protein
MVLRLPGASRKLSGVHPVVTRGLDPRVHPLRKKMDCRVKPGNDPWRVLWLGS